jgi:predicted RNA-binding Zn ribbon-like protein
VTALSDEAPGRLELLRLFENTIELPDGPDQLDLPERAATWCRRHGLPAISSGPELERLREFREAVRNVLYANNGEAESERAWEGLRRFLGSARLALRLDRDCGLGLEPAEAGSDATIASLLAIVYDALLAGTWPRLRACRKGTCRFAYYDHTKNGSRSWCSMATCGNQAKAQRRRDRERLAAR